MPIYEYAASGRKSCDHCRERFETVQRMTEPPLTACPSCGAKVERLLSSPAVHGTQAGDKKLSNRNLAEKGFTKYVKAGDGYYEKTAGKGPDVIKR